jgi:putative ABC transport system permease protein
LGSSISSIVFLLTKEFSKWILIANIIAWPVAYFAMQVWLERFAYRTGVEWWIFIVSGGMALFIALITVSYQAIRAALTNPVKSLRSE